MDYEDTKIDKKGNSLCLVFAGFLMFSLTSFVVKYFFAESKNNSELLWVIILFVPFIIMFIGIPYLNIKNSNRNRNIAKTIKEKGTKVKGSIKSIKSTYKSDYKNSLFMRSAIFRRKKIPSGGGTDKNQEYYDYAVVEYKFNGNKKTVNTPYLDFYEDDLISKDVDVFIYNDMVYVDNYKIKREEIKRKNRKWNNMKVKAVVAFIIVFILIATAISLTIVNLIPKHYLVLIIVGLLLVYFVSMSIVYLAYLDDVFSNK